MWDPFAEFQQATLPNGLTVYASHWPDRQWESMGFLVHAGSECDPAGLAGITHFLEHVVSDNAGIPRDEMKNFFNKFGGSFNLGETSYSDTRYHFFVPTKNEAIAMALEIFGKMLISGRIEKSVEKEREIISREFHECFPTGVDKKIYRHQNRALYSGYWLEKSFRNLGHLESIRRIAKKDLQSHYDKFYTPANISIVGVGGKTLSELIELIAESPFIEQKVGKRVSLPMPVPFVGKPLENRCAIKFSKHVNMSKENSLNIGAYRSAAKIPGIADISAVMILAEMLDDVLNRKIREEYGWAYAIHGSYFNLRYFREISIHCGALAIEALDKIEAAVEECISSLSNQEELFERTKEAFLASHSMVDVTGKQVCNIVLDDLSINQRIITLAEIKSNIQRVTMDDIRNLLVWLSPQQRWTCIIRP